MGVRPHWRGCVISAGWVAILLSACGTTPTPAEVPDVIYHNGVVLTMEASRPLAEALAIRAGRIVVVGDNESLLALSGDATRVVDLGGGSARPAP